LKIISYSTALCSTWIYVEDYKVLFDAGDGVSAGLNKKSSKIKNVFISHADRDHLCGLLQFNQLNTINKLPNIYYPKDCGSFPALNKFVKIFDRHIDTPEWIGIDTSTKIYIAPKIFVKAHLNDHRFEVGKIKSVGYTIIEEKTKLKSCYAGISGNQIRELKESNVEITENVEEKMFGYSGDSRNFEPELWQGVQYLVHESTFLSSSDSTRNNHTNIEEVLCKARDLNLKGLILSHFSSRFDETTILSKAKQLCKTNNINFPVYVILPGETNRDVLSNSIN